MPDTIKEFFTDEEWDMIYNLIGHGLDDDEENSDNVYFIRNKIHSLFENA
jgi:hypothetical protein